MSQQAKISRFRPQFEALTRTIRRFAVVVAVCAVVGLLTLGPAQLSAQVNTGSLRGTVQDSGQAAVSGAEITVQNTDTGSVRTSSTNDSGEYSVLALDPGNYRVTIAKRGFSSSKSTVKLDVAEVGNLNVTLRPGSVSQVVEVSGALAGVDTTDVSLGSVIHQEQVVDLPLNGRQFTQLLELEPGTVPIDTSQINGKSPSFGAGGQSPGVNGGVNRSNIFFLDGMLASNPFFGGFSYSPSIDDIEEFKEQSHTDQAEWGQSTGAQVTVVSRPGTNTFHGSAFEFFRNDALDARNYFASTKLPFHQNQFGASLGGPIIKNKLFFFANYEGGREIQGSPEYSTVPTVAERSGDFSGLEPDGKTPLPTIYDPSTYNPTTYTESPFPGNKLPSVDAGMLALMNGFYPMPNVTPSASNGFANYVNNEGTTQTADQGTVRIDYDLSMKNRLNWRYSKSDSQNSQQSALANRFTTGFSGTLTGGNWLHTYSPSLLSQITVSYNTLDIPQAITLPVNEGALFTASGVGAGFNEHPGGDPVDLAPAPSLSGANYTGFWNGAGPIGPMHIFQASGSVAKTEGKHQLKFGGAFYRTWMYTNWNGNSIDFSQKATWNAACQFDTNPDGSTNALATAQCPGGSASEGGDPAASMLLSLPDTATRNLGNSGVNLRQNTLGIFAQDSFSLTPRFTLNYGLRWDYSTPMTEADGRLATYDIYTQTYDVVKGDEDLPSTLPLNVAVLPRNSITPQHYDWFSPRLGVAYQLDSRTTLRAGAGHAYDNWGESLQVGQQNRGAWPSGFAQNASTTPLNVAGITYLPSGAPASGQNPFSVPGVVPASPLPAGGLGFQDVKWVPDSAWQWNAEVEHNFGPVGDLSVAYVGSRTVHMAIATLYNTSLPQQSSTTESFPDKVFGAPTGGFLASEGNAKYNSLQMKLSRSFTSGFSYNAAFTWSRNRGLDSCSGDTDNLCTQNQYNPTADYGPTFLDVPLIFTFNTLYQLPFGRGRAHLNSGPASEIVGNWQLNAIILARSGTVVNPGVSQNNANTGDGAQRPNEVGDPNSGAPHTITQWWNPAAFTVPGPGTFGSAGLNSLRGPGYTDVDFSVFRDFPVTERFRLQFRFEAFDLFNHPNWGTPNATVGATNFGAITNTYASGIGPGGNREIQFALKALF